MRTAIPFVFAIVVLAGCSGEPTPASPADAPAEPAVELDAFTASSSETVVVETGSPSQEAAADVIVELRTVDEFVVVLVDGDARGVVDDDDTWKAVEKLLAKFVADHPEHAKPAVAINAAHTVDTKQVIRAVDRLIEIGLENVTFHGRPPTTPTDR